MNQEEIVLAGLAAGKGAALSPVQVQKLFFLLDKNIAEIIDGPLFDFQPYAYGPFDPAVYGTLENLVDEGLVEIDLSGGMKGRRYRLTDEGARKGDGILDTMEPKVREYICLLSEWIRALSFNELVSAIYAKYPKMKARSIFRG